MKARMPYGYNKGEMQGMLKQAQKAQAEMTKKQEELEEKDYTATAGGNAVKITMNGAKVVKELKIDPEVVDRDDVEMLEDLVIAAINQVIKDIDDNSSKEMAKITNDLGLGGLF